VCGVRDISRQRDEDEVGNERKIAIAKLTELVDAMPSFRERVDRFEETARSILHGLENGRSMGDCLEEQRAHDARRQTTDAFSEFERLRHDARLAMIFLAMTEGMTKADVARGWGLSRQWASKEVDAARLRFGDGGSSTSSSS
jgi:hypothetical protein